MSILITFIGFTVLSSALAGHFDEIERDENDITFMATIEVVECPTFAPCVICAGVVISEWLVLTFAHCVYERPKTDLYIRTIQFSHEEECRSLIHVIIHEDYNHRTHDNDIAVLHVFPFLEEYKVIDKIAAPFSEPYGEAFLVGWNIYNPETLKCPNITTNRSSECLTHHSQELIEYSDGDFCIVSMPQSFDNCTGVSGSAVVEGSPGKRTLYGMMKFSKEFCSQDKIPEYIIISEYRDWIKKMKRIHKWLN